MSESNLLSFQAYKFLVALITILLFMFLLYLGCNKKNESKPGIVIPKIQLLINIENVDVPDRVLKLYSISVALEKFKLDHHSYPISGNKGESFSSFVSKNGAVDNEWIAGLVPGYMEKLPIDPRNDHEYEHQFMYKSNGAHYKLIAALPDDCADVRELYKSLITGDCYGYGFWTPGGVWW